MAIQYTNRKGKTCYLHRHTTKGGRVGYHFSLDDVGDLVEEIPAGNEIYEHPRGQVFLRKKRDPIITEDEVNIVRSEVEKRANVDHFLIDVRDKAIVVYTADQDFGELQDFFSSFGLGRRRSEEVLTRHLSYTAMMRFVLRDAEKRTFAVERYCFRGRIDDWIPLGLSRPGPLADLVREYVPHLGRDSFYDLY